MLREIILIAGAIILACPRPVAAPQKKAEAVARVDLLMARQGRLLEILAIDELLARKSHLENYGDKARFALADSYDRATQAQAKLEE